MLELDALELTPKLIELLTNQEAFRDAGAISAFVSLLEDYKGVGFFTITLDIPILIFYIRSLEQLLLPRV